jgi:hypothetical protein
MGDDGKAERRGASESVISTGSEPGTEELATWSVERI